MHKKIGMMCERLMKNIKKIVRTNFFDKTLLTMIIINNIIHGGNDNQFQIVRGNVYEPRREISRSIKSIKESWLSDYQQRKLLLHIILNHEYSSCKEIYYAAKKQDDKVGIATVYRTVQLLEDMELIHKEMVVRI